MSNLILQSLEKQRNEGIFPVIPDIKVYSPKDGHLLKGRSIKDIVMAFEKARAPCLSVVTESDYFKGSLKLLEEVVGLTKLPVLRKDFISSEDDIKMTIAAGAKSILLIASMLSAEKIGKLYHLCVKAGLEPLVEIHSADDIEKVKDLKPDFTGINNKDILVLEKDNGDVSTTETLISMINWPAFILSESGINVPDDLTRIRRAGADGALIGTAILKEADICLAYRKFYVNV